ncbi:MarR family transcriptional regulator (plasmid) [Streptomyces sp. NBC_00335]|uniref:MarR family winged helix-turn-helix transcriptional regulator n=1 Tax=unclassified Streptomyces TaxID=2593676 RepID=UPI0022559FF6|nr:MULTISPECIES: MarR family transcriptional regulator [unclassified Streptomyces]MCX5409998.1 MarR family transcriptional regulator [Streptomyces sp. NBC_00086]
MKTTTTPTTDLSFLLSWASHSLATEMTANLAEVGVTPRAHCVLHQALEGEFTQSQIADAIGLDKTTMVVITDKLEKEGLAERTPSPVDRRARIIGVTEKGRALVAQSDEIVERTHESVLSALPEGLRESFVEALTLLVEGRLATFVQCAQPPRRRSAS